MYYIGCEGRAGWWRRKNIHWVQIERVAWLSFRDYPIVILSLWVNSLYPSDAIWRVELGHNGFLLLWYSPEDNFTSNALPLQMICLYMQANVHIYIYKKFIIDICIMDDNIRCWQSFRQKWNSHFTDEENIFLWHPNIVAINTVYGAYFPPNTQILRLPSLIARIMGLTWGPSGADRTQVGPTFAPWTLLSGMLFSFYMC